MIESMLEPHLKDAAGATQTEVGLTFLILGGVYMATTPITGYVSFRISNIGKAITVYQAVFDKLCLCNALTDLW